MLSLLKRRKKGFRSIPYNMFDHEGFGLEAKNARVLERIYHKGHKHSWDGEEVLQSLLDQYGPPDMGQDKREALARVFAIIMWGELAAWRISAELADELTPLEAKMAATSQAYDEARHFYVMHDYLELLGGVPDALPWGAQRLLEDVMNADHLAKKLLGMQLMVEPVALTLFHVVKKLNVEPILTHLMPYYERDESRHVALGLQYLPAMLSQMSVRERAELWFFQMKMLTFEIWSNIDLMVDLKKLGVDPRELINTGKGKQMRALELVNQSLGMDDMGIPGAIMNRYADTLTEFTIPDRTLSVRLREAGHVLRHGQAAPAVPEELTPTITDDQTPLVSSVKEAARRKRRRQPTRASRS